MMIRQVLAKFLVGVGVVILMLICAALGFAFIGESIMLFLCLTGSKVWTPVDIGFGVLVLAIVLWGLYSIGDELLD